MAFGTPPAQGSPGLGPRPPLTAIPGGMGPVPPPGMPSGMPPMQAPMPAAPSPMSTAGPSPTPHSPFAGILADLPASLSTSWQCIDLAVRCIKTAKRGTDMQKLPAVIAVLTSQQNTLERLLTSYTTGQSSGGASASEGSSQDSGATNGAIDADAQPNMSGSGESSE